MANVNEGLLVLQPLLEWNRNLPPNPIVLFPSTMYASAENGIYTVGYTHAIHPSGISYCVGRVFALETFLQSHLSPFTSVLSIQGKEGVYLLAPSDCTTFRSGLPLGEPHCFQIEKEFQTEFAVLLSPVDLLLTQDLDQPLYPKNFQNDDLN